jgi:hypothetical protein
MLEMEDYLMSTNEEIHNSTALEPKFQMRAVVIGLFIILALIVSFVLMIIVGGLWDAEKTFNSSQLLIISALGGLFGGSARSLFMLITEIGIHTGIETKPVESYLSRWFLYLMKPFMGGASGVLFFLAVFVGFVQPLANPETNFRILPVFFIAAVGGIFFEEVFAVLNSLFTTLSSKGQPQNKD